MDKYLRVKAIYYSIEYVGDDIGKPIIVIDLFGCSRKCNWCNHNQISYNNGERGYIDYTIEDILYRVSEYNNTAVKITGGEPTEQENLTSLVKVLKECNYKVSLETNGDVDHKSFSLVDNLIVDIKPYSSGKKTELTQIDKLKRYKGLILKGIIQNQADIDYYQSNFNIDDLWLFREESNGNIENIVDRLVLNPNWRLSFRIDKIAGFDFDKVYKKIYGG